MKKILVLMVVVFISAVSLYAQSEDKNFPKTVNYTGNLFDKSGKPIDGHVDLNFKFYNSKTSDSVLWSEDQKNVQVEYGYFSVNLGTETPLNLDFSKPLWIEIKLGDSIYPRVQYKPVQYISQPDFSKKYLAPRKIGNVLIKDYYTRTFCKNSLGFKNIKSNNNYSKCSFCHSLFGIFHKEKNRSIEYVKSLKRIEYSQKMLNYAVEGSVNMKVIVNSDGKINSIEPFYYNDDILNDLVIDALLKTKFKPSRINGKNVLDSVVINLDFLLPNNDYLIDFLSKKINITRKIGTYPIYRFSELQKGKGENIKLSDNVKFECLIYSGMQELIKKDTTTVIIGTTKLVSHFEDALKTMKAGGEKLLLIERGAIFTGDYPNVDNIPYSYNFYFLLKVLEINPKN